MAVTKRTRFEVLKRDDYTCRYCRSKDNPLTIDHVIPVALGGSDDPSNLVSACKDCNSGKSSSQPDAGTVADVREDAVRWALAVRWAADEMSRKESSRVAYVDEFVDTWKSHGRYLNGDIISTVERMHDVGLPLDVMLGVADLAGRARGVNDRTAYFAGICWKRVREMQNVAADIMRES